MTKASVTVIRLDNAFLASVARLLGRAGRGALTPEEAVECSNMGDAILAAVAARSVPDDRKGNPNGGSGRPPSWFVVEDEALGVLPALGSASAAAYVGKSPGSMSVQLARAGGRWTGTRRDDNGEWGITVRRATAAEAITFDSQREQSEAVIPTLVAERAATKPKGLAGRRRIVVDGD